LKADISAFCFQSFSFSFHGQAAQSSALTTVPSPLCSLMLVLRPAIGRAVMAACRSNSKYALSFGGQGGGGGMFTE
jgi:hypothetical protein